MCAAALAGDREEAVRLHDRPIPLHKALFLEPNPDGRQAGGASHGLAQRRGDSSAHVAAF
ncbi:MAG: hypothetical protein R3E95_23170 [Thiolinea sp.]